MDDGNLQNEELKQVDQAALLDLTSQQMVRACAACAIWRWSLSFWAVDCDEPSYQASRSMICR